MCIWPCRVAESDSLKHNLSTHFSQFLALLWIRTIDGRGLDDVQDRLHFVGLSHDACLDLNTQNSETKQAIEQQTCSIHSM